MSELPIVADLLTLETDAERADWLIRCPDGVYAGWVASVNGALTRSGFRAALPYAAARAAASWSLRTEEGLLPRTVVMAVLMAEYEMKAAAKAERGEHG